jgi:division protein CdvB (Snf7/Vps24/ESCRT-III family)
MFDREFGILQRKGALDQGSPLEPPSSLSNKEINIEFTSPFDRLRRSSELMGITQTLQVMAPLAQEDPTIFDNLDKDETFRTVAEVSGMPKRLLTSREDMQKARDQRQAQQAQAAVMQQAEQAGKAAKGIPALAQAPQAIEGIQNAMGQLNNAIPQGTS